jgi:DNA-cytosine methyltransferase
MADKQDSVTPKASSNQVAHLDLFSGIGGFAYAIDQVWDNVGHIFCDNDPFCRQVLNKHWPEAKIYDDIRHITDTASQGRQGEKAISEGQLGQPDRPWQDQKPYILTGGFPCQPFSSAGVRRGTSDERYLWPEMLRVIRLTKPKWVIAENVRGLLTMQGGLVFEQICSDLEASGYEVQPFIIPALAVNAPHRRDRVWIVANATGNGRWQAPAAKDEKGYAQEPAENWQLAGRFERPHWDEQWMEVASELHGVDDGLSPKLRKDQLKAYGNAIVPEVAIEIMKGMK